MKKLFAIVSFLVGAAAAIAVAPAVGSIALSQVANTSGTYPEYQDIYMPQGFEQLWGWDINGNPAPFTIGSGLTFNPSTNTLSAAGGSATWGGITGTLSNQTDLQTALNGKQPLATNLTSLAGLSYSSLAFVKMSASGTFSLDTSTYLTAAVTSLAGTSNQITASASTGSVTLSLPSTLIAPGNLQVTTQLGVGVAPSAAEVLNLGGITSGAAGFTGISMTATYGTTGSSTFTAVNLSPHMYPNGNNFLNVIGLDVAMLGAGVGGGTIGEFQGINVNNSAAGGYGVALQSGVAIASQTGGSNGNVDLLLGTLTVPSGNWLIYQSDSYPSLVVGTVNLGAGALNYGSLSSGLASTLYTDGTTVTITGTTGAPNFASTYHDTQTFTNASSSTITNLATVMIAGAPSVAGSQSATNLYALDVLSGNSYFGGNITSPGGVISSTAPSHGAGTWALGTVRTSTGLAVSTTTGIQVVIGGTPYTLPVLTTNP